MFFSLAFYAWGEPVWITLLIFSAAIDYVHGLIIEKNRGTWKAKAALISSLVLNLSLLGFFKYSQVSDPERKHSVRNKYSLKQFQFTHRISFIHFRPFHTLLMSTVTRPGHRPHF